MERTMQTKSHISAAALAAALFAVPQLASGQILGVDLDLDVLGVEADADVDLGGDKLLDVDAGVSLGDDAGLDASVEVGGTDADDSLVDIDLNASGSGADADDATTGPNGGRLIDLGVSNDDAVLDGTIRIGALDDDRRAQALLDLIADPDLAELDLDAAIDDRRVSILAAADLLSDDDLARIDAAVTAGGDGRRELLAALEASVELGAILDKEGIDPTDVLAVQVADNGAAEIIVLGDRVHLALLGDDGDAADLAVDDLATGNVDLLSGEELAEADIELLPQGEQPITTRLRLLANADPDDGQVDLADLSIAELSQLDIDLLTGGDSAGGNGGAGGSDDGGSTGGAGDDGSGAGNGGSGDNGSDSGGSGSDDGSGNGGDDTGSATDDADGAIDGDLAIPVGAGFGIATLGCNIGVLALANGVDATPGAIARADSLELVRIDGCERSLVDAEIGTIRSAIAVNPSITDALDDASIPLDHVIGATIQGGTLTLFIEPAVS
jgi:hypothetical protein